MASGGGTSTWERILSQSATEPGALARCFPIDPDELERVISRYPMRLNPYYLGLIREVGDPIYRQCIPDGAEVDDERGLEDPLNEEGASPVPGLTHRYPDRVLFLVSGECPVYCRFCNRKRKVGRPSMVTPESIRLGLEYIRDHKEVRDVLLSGGDPLLLRDAELHGILARVRAIPHVEIIRIGSRVPCTLPQRVTARLAGLLKAFHPLYISTHFNHPREVTPEAARACGRLADAGIPLGCQTVLLKGVNDDAGTIRELMLKLLRIRVRPYYLFQADLARGTAHFWTPLHLGLDITKRLQTQALGPGAPQFAVDLPGGGGKIPLQADTGQWAGEDRVPVKPPLGRAVRGPSVHALGETTPCPEAVGREWT